MVNKRVSGRPPMSHKTFISVARLLARLTANIHFQFAFGHCLLSLACVFRMHEIMSSTFNQFQYTSINFAQQKASIRYSDLCNTPRYMSFLFGLHQLPLDWKSVSSENKKRKLWPPLLDVAAVAVAVAVAAAAAAAAAICIIFASRFAYFSNWKPNSIISFRNAAAVAVTVALLLLPDSSKCRMVIAVGSV